MPSVKKQQELVVLSELMRGAQGYYFLDFTGIAANDFGAVRRELRAAGAQVRVVKNRLALRALVESGVSEEVAVFLKGPTSVVVAREDAVVPARVLKEMTRKLAALRVKGAYVDRTFFDAARFEFLASLPSKADLRGHLVGVLSAPIWGLAMTLEGVLNEFVYVLDQLRERRSDAPSGA